MFQSEVQSLDTPLTASEGEDLTVRDTLAAADNLEQDVIDQISEEQLHSDLWDTVTNVLKNDSMIEILRLRHVEGLTLEQTGNWVMHRKAGRNLENKALLRLRGIQRPKNSWSL
jgi:DNA-directed RNA polymerase sigma subunit (sigma70/sigma32)